MARNRTFNEISIGDTATIHRVCTANDLVIFAHASGNLNPLSLPHDQDRDGHTDPDTIAPSMWVGSQISAILGNSLPGAGTKYRSQTLNFYERVHVGDELAMTVTVTDKREPGIVILSCTLTNQKGELVADGIAEVLAPTEHIDTPDAAPAEAGGSAPRKIHPHDPCVPDAAAARHRGRVPDRPQLPWAGRCWRPKPA